jgi:hypothetical protein
MPTENTQETGVMPQAEMIKQIWDEVRYVRAKLDSHSRENKEEISGLKEDVGSIKQQITGHKIKLGLIFSGIGIAITGLFALVIKHLDSFV